MNIALQLFLFYIVSATAGMLYHRIPQQVSIFSFCHMKFSDARKFPSCFLIHTGILFANILRSIIIYFIHDRIILKKCTKHSIFFSFFIAQTRNTSINKAKSRWAYFIWILKNTLRTRFTFKLILYPRGIRFIYHFAVRIFVFVLCAVDMFKNLNLILILAKRNLRQKWNVNEYRKTDKKEKYAQTSFSSFYLHIFPIYVAWINRFNHFKIADHYGPFRDCSSCFGCSENLLNFLNTLIIHKSYKNTDDISLVLLAFIIFYLI